jgi:hypothetical protein
MKPTASFNIRRVIGFAGICAGVLFVAVGSARADTVDCFPLCVNVPPSPSLNPNLAVSESKAPASEPVADTAEPTTCVTRATTDKNTAKELVAKFDAANEKIKPVKELVGYVQSPTSLAVKLVNDHVVKIPAWVGYAMDPLGSIKNKAMSEARERTKASLKKTLDTNEATHAVGACPPNEVGHAMDKVAEAKKTDNV